MEANELKLNARPGNILQFIKDVSMSFVDLADRKHISFNYVASSISPLYTSFDHDKLERILFNLLSNAFKFTPVNGQVWVEVSIINKDGNSSPSPGKDDIPPAGDNVELYIKVRDTGIGIARDQQERIFDRFFQTRIPDSILNQGSGIGLAITLEFVKMHRGRVTVESELNKGSCFTVMLPCKRLSIDESPTTQPAENIPLLTAGNGHTDIIDSPSPPPSTSPSSPRKKKSILIVEDNEDFRFYLKDNLRANYNIHEASDGRDGWKKALSLHPDLVVSDISMPVMNGIELCKKIRTDPRTQQIPVILLTALTEEHTQLKSLETGASDFIAKPFNFEVLQSRVRNLLEYKETIRNIYQRQVDAGPAHIEVRSADDEFLQSVLRELEKNITNPDLSVEELSHLLNTSRSTFYKRLLLITGRTPVEFIRYFRLKRGAELLEKKPDEYL